MNKLLWAVSVCMVMFFIEGCKKSSSNTNVNLSIVGNWELTIASGMGGAFSYAPGNGNTWQFTATNYTQYLKDSIADEGTYTAVKDNTITNVQLGGVLNLNSSAGARHPEFYLQNSNTLILDFGSAFDAPVYTYRRK